MRKSTNRFKRLDTLINELKKGQKLPIMFNAVIYTDEDNNLAHAFDREGKSISAKPKKMEKKLRKAFGLSKKDKIYLVITQFEKRENYHECINYDQSDTEKTVQLQKSDQHDPTEEVGVQSSRED